MKIRAGRRALLGALASLLTACGGAAHTPDCPAQAEGAATDPWRAAMEDAAVIEADEVRPLTPITGERATVVTYTRYPDSFHANTDVQLAWGETWVTLDGDLSARCRTYAAEHVTSDVQMLLGLPVKTEDRFVVTLDVATADLFRPCASPSLAATTCDAAVTADTPVEHAAWYARQTATAYQLPAGFPWTRLGYTYDWHTADGQAAEVGLNELVIKKGASARVISVVPTAAYCAPAGS